MFIKTTFRHIFRIRFNIDVVEHVYFLRKNVEILRLSEQNFQYVLKII